MLYKDAHTPTVASALAHELAEALIDPFCNQWISSNDDGTILVAKEVADPVQDNIVPIKLPDRSTVGLSDFIYPSWTDSQAVKGPFNYLATLQRPFQVAPGGYVVQLDATTGEVSYVFGDKVPQWTRDQKLATKKYKTRKSACAAKCAKSASATPSSSPGPSTVVAEPVAVAAVAAVLPVADVAVHLEVPALEPSQASPAILAVPEIALVEPVAALSDSHDIVAPSLDTNGKASAE